MIVRHVPVLGAALLLLVSCGQSEPSRLYTLSAASELAGDGIGDLAVGVGPITLPQYLDRPQIVTRVGANRLEVAQFDRWAEPLSATVPRVITENIGAELGTERVYVLPRRRRSQIDFAVEIEFIRFESTSEGDALLVARWELFSSGDDAPLFEDKAEIRYPVSQPGDYGLIAAGLSNALAELSGEIAQEIGRLLSGD